jgi:hypothetical protein
MACFFSIFSLHQQHDLLGRRIMLLWRLRSGLRFGWSFTMARCGAPTLFGRAAPTPISSLNIVTAPAFACESWPSDGNHAAGMTCELNHAPSLGTATIIVAPQFLDIPRVQARWRDIAPSRGHHARLADFHARSD